MAGIALNAVDAMRLQTKITDEQADAIEGSLVNIQQVDR